MPKRGWLLPLLLALGACLPVPPDPTPPAITRLGVTPDLAPRVLTLLAQYRAQRAGAELDLEVISYPAARQAMERGELEGLITLQPPPSGWFATPLGEITLVAVVHKANPLARIRLEQLRALLRGEIQDWAELGGAAGPIQPVVPVPGSDLRWALGQVPLGVERFASYTRLVADGEAVVGQVAAEPGGFGVAPLEMVDGWVKRVELEGLPGADGAEGLPAQALAIAPREPSPPLRDFLLWIQQNGF